jgi:hypothetical protein
VIDSSILVFRGSLHGLAMAAACGVGLLLMIGCGGGGDRPTLGRVHGRVTMDGEPLAKAGIAFQPKEKGRESFARTDAKGEYELTYLGEVKGAGIGENSVRITTQKSNDPKTETVPAKYNKQTTLRFEVKAGDNEANFDLTSKQSPPNP